MNEKIEVKDLTVSYDRRQVIWDVNLEIVKGAITGIVGPNGAGKSTLIKAMLGIVKPVSGSVSFFGKTLGQMKGKIAYVSQRSSVDWDFPITALEVIMMGLFGEMGLCRWPGKEEKRRAMAVLEKIGMQDLAHKQISELSGGQQQRLFVGRALLSDAEIFFLDEPFSAIDLATETYLMEIFRELQSLGKTILIVHHDLKSVEKYFDYLIMLNLRLIAFGKCKEVFNRKNLSLMFGGTSSILEKALQLSEEVKEGVR